MNQAGYERRAHDDGLAFFQSHIVPYMGPYQSQKDSQSWQSFMTDDFSPFEYVGVGKPHQRFDTALNR